MNLVEKHIITTSDPRYKECLAETRKSKDLRNAALFINRQHYAARNGKDFIEDVAYDINYDYVSWMTVDKLLKKRCHPAYKAMLANSAQETLKMVDQEYKSFFALINLKKQGLYEEKVSVPNYSKKNGYYPVAYNRGELSDKYLSKGRIRIPKTNVVFDGLIHLENMKKVRLVPHNGYIVLEVVYELPDVPVKEDNGRYAAIDPGVDNLAAVFSNVFKPFLISGGPLKSINQYYNKKLSTLKSLLAENKNTVINDVTNKVTDQLSSHATEQLGMKRDNKISDFMQKASSLIVQILVSNQVNTLIVGHSKGWKQSTKMRHKSKEQQNFQTIPFNKFIFMLRYKCQMRGIRFVVQEESYTSKASAIDGDYIPTYDPNMPKEERVKMVKFSGRRLKRGLYRTKDGLLVNADVNGAANALRKNLQGVCDAAALPADRGFVMNPVQATILFQDIKSGSKARTSKPGRKKKRSVCEKQKH